MATSPISTRSRSASLQSDLSDGSRSRSRSGSNYSNRSGNGSTKSHRSRSGSNHSGRSRSGSVQSNKSGSGSDHSNRSRSGSNNSNRSRSGSVQSNRSRSGSAHSNGSRSGSNYSNKSRSGSSHSNRSRSGSNNSNRSRSGSNNSNRSRSGSNNSSRSRSGSNNSNRSRSGSNNSNRSRSGSNNSNRSRSGSNNSNRSRSGSNNSNRSRSGSNNSNRSRSGSNNSNRSRSGSNNSNRSRSGSNNSNRSRSGSNNSNRSRSGSAMSNRSRSRSGSAGSRGRSDSDASQRKSRSKSPSSKKTRSRSMSSEGSPIVKEKKDKSKPSDGLMVDIFGSSDEDEADDFEGFTENMDAVTAKRRVEHEEISGDEGRSKNDYKSHNVSDSSDEGVVDGSAHHGGSGSFVSDFDEMMAKKKEERGQSMRRRKNMGEALGDSDDRIADIIINMKQAAEDDRLSNESKQPAVLKLKQLGEIMNLMRKPDLHQAFLDQGILNEWLAPLPDKSLPHLKIRGTLLNQLVEFPPLGTELLKMSGIGKAIMYLYKHPKESRVNRAICGKLINEWSRPIFNLTSNYKCLTREEREERDYEHLPKKRRISLDQEEKQNRDIDKAMVDEERALRPGDKGWVIRARVPQPSHKDYVVRPKWNIEERPKGQQKKVLNRFERHKRGFAEKKRNAKNTRAINISVEGRKMNE